MMSFRVCTAICFNMFAILTSRKINEDRKLLDRNFAKNVSILAIFRADGGGAFDVYTFYLWWFYLSLKCGEKEYKIYIKNLQLNKLNYKYTDGDGQIRPSSSHSTKSVFEILAKLSLKKPLVKQWRVSLQGWKLNRNVIVQKKTWIKIWKLTREPHWWSMFI